MKEFLLPVSKVGTYHVRVKDNFHALLSKMLLLLLVRVEILPITIKPQVVTCHGDVEGAGLIHELISTLVR